MHGGEGGSSQSERWGGGGWYTLGLWDSGVCSAPLTMGKVRIHAEPQSESNPKIRQLLPAYMTTLKSTASSEFTCANF